LGLEKNPRYQMRVRWRKADSRAPLSSASQAVSRVPTAALGSTVPVAHRTLSTGAQPGETSTLIGARRLAQLEDNLKALDVKLSAEELGRLDALTKPALGFPQSIQPWFSALHNGGTSVNGVYAPPSIF
jgi:aryl-alcohol dehydrogenase-like predicted oxidoreductase